MHRNHTFQLPLPFDAMSTSTHSETIHDAQRICGWTLLVALSENGVIGRQGDLPWRLSSDLQRFKKLTMGHCLLMGRKTFESIGRPLPGRQTIVLSRGGFSDAPEGVAVVANIEDVPAHVEPGRSVMVVGGAQIYEQTLAVCDTLLLTRVLAQIEGDVCFPEVEWADWELESETYFEAGPKDDWPTKFQQWTRTTRPTPS